MAQILRLTLADKTYDFSEDTSENTELIALEDITGYETGELIDKLNRGSVRALTAVLWLCMRREQPTLQLGDVKFRAVDLGVEFVNDEEPGKDEVGSSGS